MKLLIGLTLLLCLLCVEQVDAKKKNECPKPKGTAVLNQLTDPVNGEPADETLWNQLPVDLCNCTDPLQKGYWPAVKASEVDITNPSVAMACSNQSALCLIDNKGAKWSVIPNQAGLYAALLYAVELGKKTVMRASLNCAGIPEDTSGASFNGAAGIQKGSKGKEKLTCKQVFGPNGTKTPVTSGKKAKKLYPKIKSASCTGCDNLELGGCDGPEYVYG